MRLAIAEFQLKIFTHWSECETCKIGGECESINKLTMNDFTDHTGDCASSSNINCISTSDSLILLSGGSCSSVSIIEDD